MEFRKIDLGPIELIEDRMSKQNHLIQQNIFCLTRVNWNMEFPEDQF